MSWRTPRGAGGRLAEPFNLQNGKGEVRIKEKD
jgi:hypothetical protein